MEVQLVCHATLIGNIPLFQNASDNVMRHVMMSIESEIFLPGDYIFRAGDEATKLYMVQSGSVDILSSTDSFIVNLCDGAYFGEVALLTDVKRTASAKALQYVTCDTLDKHHFNEIRGMYVRERSERIPTRALFNAVCAGSQPRLLGLALPHSCVFQALFTQLARAPLLTLTPTWLAGTLTSTMAFSRCAGIRTTRSSITARRRRLGKTTGRRGRARTAWT